MSKWDGKSKGGVLGYKFFVFCIKNLGINSSYFVLYFVAAYYFFFLKKTNRVTYYYFRRRLGFSPFKARRHVYFSYYTYGQTLIDKVAIAAGLKDRYTFEFDGSENLQNLLDKKLGGILISAHIGNFDIAQYFFSKFGDVSINLVISDLEHRAIKKYLESISAKSKIKVIVISDDMSHIYAINRALSCNELICFTGDRYLEGAKYIAARFLEKEANFPAGPFIIASRLQVPVVFVYVMKEPGLHYHLFAREAEVKQRDEKSLLEAYLTGLEQMVNRYPLQWYNYFDFWNVYSK